jgi:hypothetical protein
MNGSGAAPFSTSTSAAITSILPVAKRSLICGPGRMRTVPWMRKQYS